MRIQNLEICAREQFGVLRLAAGNYDDTNLTLTGSQQILCESVDLVTLSSTGARTTLSGSGNVIANCTIVSPGSDPALAMTGIGSGTGIQIKDSDIHGAVSSIFITGGNITISGNHIHDGFAGVAFDSDPVDGVVISNNSFQNMSVDDIDCEAGTAPLAVGSGNTDPLRPGSVVSCAMCAHCPF